MPTLARIQHFKNYLFLILAREFEISIILLPGETETKQQQ
jgi:hypothetical protein